MLPEQRFSDRDIEQLARRVVNALVWKGIFRVITETPERGEYVNRETGDRLTIDWDPRPATVIRVPIPPRLGKDRLSVETVREILAIEANVFTSDGRAPSASDLIRDALRAAAVLTRADFVTFHPSAHEAEPGPAPLPAAHESVLRELLPLDGEAAVFLPDLGAHPAVHHVAPAPDHRSVVFAPVRTRDGKDRGLLEAWSRRTGFLEWDDLVAFALLADRFAEGLRKAEALERFVFFDRLTGLYNREFFNLQLEKEIARARRAEDSFALVIADLDDFKAMNTSYGYYGANELLEQLAGLLKRSIRPFDIASRWGGEEFALILTSPISGAEATVVCNRLRETIEGHTFRTTGLDSAVHEVALTISVGVSLFPHAATTSRDLWVAANAALQAAKRSGKNRVVDASGLPRETDGRRHQRPPGGGP
jgi:diguanylate cyclase (GGDEF)-like protein